MDSPDKYSTNYRSSEEAYCIFGGAAEIQVNMTFAVKNQTLLLTQQTCWRNTAAVIGIKDACHIFQIFFFFNLLNEKQIVIHYFVVVHQMKSKFCL